MSSYIFKTILISLFICFGRSTPVKLCVTTKLEELCKQMEKDMPETWKCVIARDKLDCAHKLKNNEADLSNMNERAIYLAGKYFDVVPIANEVIDGRNYKYGGVALVSKTSNITTPSDLRGRRSCHTGVGRTVGWHIPLAFLLAIDVMQVNCASTEFKAVQDFFSGGSCAPGNWSNDPMIDRELKREYISLCSNCKETCDADDPYAGYQGAVRCLLEDAGDVAFTKINIVRDMMKEDPSLVYKVDFLCLEGGRQNLTAEGDVCTWGKRPANAYVTGAENKTKTDMLMAALNTTQARYPLPRNNAPEWFHKVFLSGTKVSGLRRIPEPYTSFQDYLGSFINVIEKIRPGCPNSRKSFCTTTELEFLKCQDYVMAATAQGLWPLIDCVQSDSKLSCMQNIKDGHADVVVLDGGDIYRAGRYYGMKPIAAELYGATEGAYYAVAVIRSASDVGRLSQLQGLRSCHTGIGRTAGWVVPIGALLDNGDIPDNECDRAQAVGEFFSAGSCVPGANNTKFNPKRSRAKSLCRQCIGDQDGRNKCDRDSKERYSGYAGAFRCLADGQGEVAFVKHTTVKEHTDGRSSNEFWSRDLLSSDFQLLCKTGGTASINDYLDCNLAKVPSHHAMMRVNSSRMERLTLTAFLADSSKFFGDDSDFFKLLHRYSVDGADLIFKDSTTKLKAVPLKSSYVDVLGLTFYKACEAVDPRACLK